MGIAFTDTLGFHREVSLKYCLTRREQVANSEMDGLPVVINNSRRTILPLP